MSRPPTPDGVPPVEVLERAAGRLTRLGSPHGGLPYVGDGVDRTMSLVDNYAELIAVSMARARFYGELLAAQREAAVGGERDPWQDDSGDGDGDAEDTASGLGGPSSAAGLIGFTYAAATVGDRGSTELDRVATGEEIRGLVKLEADERDRAARLIKDALRLGADLQKTEVMRGYAATVSAALRVLIGELGLSMDDATVLRAAKRAGLAARRAVGQDDGDPDLLIGPALTSAERGRLLADALTRAQG